MPKKEGYKKESNKEKELRIAALIKKLKKLAGKKRPKVGEDNRDIIE